MVSEILGISKPEFPFQHSTPCESAHYIKMCNIVIYIKLSLLIHADNYIVHHANKFNQIKSNQISCLLNPCRDALSTNLLSYVFFPLG